MFHSDWPILRILHQSFEIERPKGHWSEVVVHLYIQIRPLFSTGLGPTGSEVLVQPRKIRSNMTEILLTGT